MLTKRILAIVISALMLLTIIPTAAFAFSDPAPGFEETEVTKAEISPKTDKPEKKEEIASLGDNLYINGTDLPYQNSSPGFTAQETTTDGTTYYWIESNNYSQANTEATFTISSFRMEYSETITFQYWYETESGYDKFIFKDNGTQVFQKSGSSSGWESYTYTCTSTGNHEFEFIYHKDGSNDTGEDCVRIGYLSYSKQASFYMTRAALKAGLSGNIISVETTGTYPFYVKETTGTHDLYVYSGNKGVGNSTSTLTVKAWVEQAPIDFSFSYAISCEVTYDHLTFSVNGAEEFRASGTNDYSWTSHTYTCQQKGLYTFTFVYFKDGNINNGEDVVCIDDLRFSAQNAEQRALDYNYCWDDERNLNAINSDAILTFNSPKGETSYIGTNNSGGNDYRAINNNRYINNSTSYIETIVNMAAGETLSFQYQVSSEEDYDGLVFSVNGDTELFASGWQNSSWRTFTYTAPSTGSYVMRWAYTKDGSNSEGYDFAMIDTVRYTGSHNYGSASSGWGYHNAFTPQTALISDSNGGECTVSSDYYAGNDYFLPYKESGNNCMISRNKYFESTTAYMDVYVSDLQPGDQIVFEYTVRSESTDKLRVSIDANGTSNDVNQLFNGSSSDTWHTFTWTAAYAESLTVYFEFTKDSTVNTEPDCAMIRNFAVIKAQVDWPNLDVALNPDGANPSSPDYLSFTNDGTHPFEIGNYEGRIFARSTNQGVASSNCSATTSFMVGAAGTTTISFDYVVSSEQNYDKLIFYIDGVQMAAFSGNTEGDETWQTYTCEVSAGMHEFTWTYQKDSSVDGGYDTCALDNIRFENSSSGGPGNGDVDGNGTVNVTDAIMALRHAMGVMTLTSAQLARGDVDGNGVVNVTDAVRIMRIAMGISS